MTTLPSRPSGKAVDSVKTQRRNGASAGLMRDLYEHPGHMFRRAQQISTSVFYDKVGNDVTPIQLALLSTLRDHPGVDQVTLAGLVGLDTSTAAATAVRLEEKGLVERRLEVVLRRQRRLFLTPEGERKLASLSDGLMAMREQLLERLSPNEQKTLMRLLRKFVDVNNEFSRAPLGGVSRPPKKRSP